MPELMKLLSTKSMMRYLPPKGTAGLARSLVRGQSRVPLPPARTMPSTRIRIGFSRILFQAAVGNGKRKLFAGGRRGIECSRCLKLDLPLPYYLYPIPCLVCDALHVQSITNQTW